MLVELLVNFWFSFPGENFEHFNRLTHSLSSLNCGQCIFLSSTLQNTMFWVVFFPRTAPKQTHVDLFYGLSFLLREDCALLLSFSESTLQRTETVFFSLLYCCCCCYCRCRWAFQPYAALSHIIPLWVWWWHWCGLLLLGSLPCISHKDLFFFYPRPISRLYSITGKWEWSTQQPCFRLCIVIRAVTVHCLLD